MTWQWSNTHDSADLQVDAASFMSYNQVQVNVAKTPLSAGSRRLVEGLYFLDTCKDINLIETSLMGKFVGTNKICNSKDRLAIETKVLPPSPAPTPPPTKSPVGGGKGGKGGKGKRANLRN